MADPVTDLETLLQDLHSALRLGEFGHLGELTRSIEAAVQGLSGAALSETAARHLRDLATRNAACLEGAERGIRAARRRLAEIRAVQAGTRTYDDQGRSQLIAPAAGRLARRA